MAPPSLRSAAERVWPLIALWALVGLVVLLATTAPPSMQRVVTDALIKLTVVVGASIFIGNSGILSFGHISFMAIGAYVSAWLTIPAATKAFLLPRLPGFLAAAEWPVLPAALVAGLVAMVFAFLVGLPLVRLSGIAASIGTFAVLMIVYTVFSNWSEMTGGATSLYGLPSYTTMTVAFVWSVAAIGVAFLYQQSRFGFRLRGTREDEAAATSLGIDVRRERLIALVLSSFFVAIGGVLYAHFIGVVVAGSFYLNLTFLTIAMLVIGGINSLSGAVVGVIVVSVVAELLRRAENGMDLMLFVTPSRPGLREVGLAAILLLILLFRPKGIMGGREIPFPHFLFGPRTPRPAGTEPTADQVPGKGSEGRG